MGEEIYNTPEELKNLYALIGSIASGWSHVEQAVDVTLWSLTGLDSHVGACLTAQIQSLGYRLDALVALVALRGGSKDLLRDINRFRGEADELNRSRNRVIHDPITMAEGEEPAAITITARKTLTFGIVAGKTVEYTKVNERIASLLMLFLELEKRIQIELLRTVRVPER
jgi:hypothetical protein